MTFFYLLIKEYSEMALVEATISKPEQSAIYQRNKLNSLIRILRDGRRVPFAGRRNCPESSSTKHRILPRLFLTFLGDSSDTLPFVNSTLNLHMTDEQSYLSTECRSISLGNKG